MKMNASFDDPILEEFVSSNFNQKVEFIQRHGMNYENDKWSGKTFLHIAAIHGDLELIQFLIDNGADVNAKDNNGIGCSPLFDSISLNSQDEKCFKFLIKSGADVNMEELYRTTTPLHFAVKYSPLNFVKILLDNGAKFDIIPKNQYIVKIQTNLWNLLWNWLLGCQNMKL